MDPKNVFQALQKEIRENVDLQLLVPLLNQAKILTDSEYQELIDEAAQSRDARTAQLITVLQRRGPSCPTKFLQCLRAERCHCGHSYLADLVEEFLKKQDTLLALADLALSDHSHRAARDRKEGSIASDLKGK